MGGCSVVVMLIGLAAASVAVLIAVFGITGVCLLSGTILLILSFTILRKDKNKEKYHTLRIIFIVIGILSLLVSIGGITILIGALKMFST